MDGYVTTLLPSIPVSLEKTEYVHPSQLLHHSLNQNMPYWMRPVHKPKRVKDQDARSFIEVLAAEEKHQQESSLHTPSLPVRKPLDKSSDTLI